MENTLGQRVKMMRKKLGITQNDVKNHLNIGQSTLSSIENDKFMPSSETLLELSKLFNVSPSWLLTGKNDEKRKYSPKESSCLELFNQLSPLNQERILERMETIIDVLQKGDEIYKAIPLINSNAVAASTEALESNHAQLLQTPKIKADFALTVEDESMEPVIANGSIIFIHQTNYLENGEIGIFQIKEADLSTNEKIICKIYSRLAPEHIELLSINPKFPPIYINPTQQSFKIVGKVIL